MAKSNSYNKREIEKNKQQKRKEKRQRKEERKNNPTSTFDDMIAYVDENGMITDTPPDETKVEEIEMEDIEISVPKKEEVDENQDLTGRVEFFDEKKGFGFIKDLTSVNKYFFHISNSDPEIKENKQVTFKLERNSKGLSAIEVKIIK